MREITMKQHKHRNSGQFFPSAIMIKLTKMILWPLFPAESEPINLNLSYTGKINGRCSVPEKYNPVSSF